VRLGCLDVVVVVGLLVVVVEVVGSRMLGW
jgi:hypothetical protein